MKKKSGWWISVFFFLITVSVHAQDINAHSPKPAAGSPQQRTAEKKKIIQQQKIADAIEKGKQRHLKLQTKNTKKMMRKSKQTSKRWNEDRKTFFLKRWFTKKHH